MALDFFEIDALVVDDEPFLRKTMRQMLKTLHVKEVREATNGAHALSELIAWDPGNLPNLILCDISMEPMSGLEFVDRVRGHRSSAIAETPVIMVTAHTDLDTVKMASDRDIDGYLVKPFNKGQLEARIVSIMDQIPSR